MCVLMPVQVLVLVLVLEAPVLVLVLVLGHKVFVLVLESQVLDNNTEYNAQTVVNASSHQVHGKRVIWPTLW